MIRLMPASVIRERYKIGRFAKSPAMFASLKVSFCGITLANLNSAFGKEYDTSQVHFNESRDIMCALIAPGG